jgi:hypothetical protein
MNPSGTIYGEVIGNNWFGPRPVIPAKVLPLFTKWRKAARLLYLRFVIDGVDSTSAHLSSGGKQVSLDLDPDLGENAIFDDRVLGGGDLPNGF